MDPDVAEALAKSYLGQLPPEVVDPLIADPLRVDYTLEVIEAGTKLTNWVELEPSSILSRVLVPLAASQIEAAVASNLERLKQILEHTPI